MQQFVLKCQSDKCPSHAQMRSQSPRVRNLKIDRSARTSNFVLQRVLFFQTNKHGFKMFLREFDTLLRVIAVI